MTDTTAAEYRDRTSRELGLAGNHPDAIAKHLDAYEAAVSATAYRKAADLVEHWHGQAPDIYSPHDSATLLRHIADGGQPNTTPYG